MKKVMVVAMLLRCVFVFGQNLKYVKFEQDKITYENVVEFEQSEPSEDLYKYLKNWVSTVFKSEKAVISTDSKEDGLIKLSGNTAFLFDNGIVNQSEILYFKMTFKIKEGKYKIIISDVEIGKMGIGISYYFNDKNEPKRFTRKVLVGINSELNRIIESCSDAKNIYKKSKEW